MLSRALVFEVVVILIAAVLTAGEGRAQSVPDDAREASERARRAYNIGRWQEAIDGFERSYQMTGDPALLFNLAQAHRQLGNATDALRLYRAYLREKPNGPDRAVAQERIAELERQRAQAATLVPPSVAPVPPIPGPSPTGVAAPPPIAPSQQPGVVRIEPSPSAAPGPGSPALLQAQAAPVSQATDLRATPLPRWLPWAGAGLTVALATGAIVTGISSNQRFDSLQISCGQTESGCPESDIEAVKSRTLLANIMWIAAGTMAVATGVGVYVNTREAGVAGLWRY